MNLNVIKHKTSLLNLAAELGNISQAYKIMGFSRDTFYRYQSAKESGGLEALLDVSRRKPNIKNRVDEQTEHAVVDFAIAFPDSCSVQRHLRLTPLSHKSRILSNYLGINL